MTYLLNTINGQLIVAVILLVISFLSACACDAIGYSVLGAWLLVSTALSGISGVLTIASAVYDFHAKQYYKR